jgi:hypothetical protein
MMARNPNPGKGLLAKAMGAANSQPIHPVMAGVQFNALHRANGGATMNVHTGKPTQVGDKGYAVGGASDNAGKRILTHTTSPHEELHQGGQSEPSLGTTIHHAIKLRKATSANPNSNMGSWQNDSGRIDIDASDVVHSRHKAESMGRARGEAAIFGFQHAETIRTDTPPTHSH